MGYHYFNKELIDDLVVDVSKPEGLVYAPAEGTTGSSSSPSSTSSRAPSSNPPGVSEPPSVLGQADGDSRPGGGLVHPALSGSGARTQPGCSAHWSPEVACT